MTPPAGTTDRDRASPAERILGGPMTIAALVLAAGLLATWLPHFLTWPLWVDADTYLMMARAWQRGQLPYRDIVAVNFPGEVYVAAVLGRVFGWGNAPMALRLFDVATVVGFGAALIAWSRRRFGRALPGAIGFVALLLVYLDIDVIMVIQRDWHGPALAFGAVLLIEAGRTRWTRAASALLFAAGFAFRPHVALFLPAVLSALLESRPDEQGDLPSRTRTVVEWAVAFAAGIFLVALPLLVAGVLPDFVRGLAPALPGGAYAAHGRSVRDGFLVALWGQAFHVKRILFPAAAWLLAARLRLPHRALARTWAVATACGLAYQPVHPYALAYLEIPIRVLTAVDAAVVAGVVLSAAAWSPRARLAAVAVTAWLAIPGTPFNLPERPQFCSVSDSVAAIGFLARGETPESTPPGARIHFLPFKSGHYAWQDYVHTLAHLRANTSPTTRVAPMFMNWCFPAVLGVTDRTAVFPADAGMLSVWFLGPEYERICADALERTPDSVVVWVPGEDVVSWGYPLSELERTVRRLYVPDAKFGAIEVWRRR